MANDFDDSGALSGEAKWVILIICLTVFCLIVFTLWYCVVILIRKKRMERSGGGPSGESPSEADSFDMSVDAFEPLLVPDPYFLQKRGGLDTEATKQYEAGRRAAVLFERNRQLTVFTKALVLSLNGHRKVSAEDSEAEGVDVTNTEALQEARLTLEASCGFSQKKPREAVVEKGGGGGGGGAPAAAQPARPDLDFGSVVACALPYMCRASDVLRVRETLAAFAEAVVPDDNLLLVVLDGDLLVPLQNEMTYGERSIRKQPEEEEEEEDLEAAHRLRGSALDVVFRYSSSEEEDLPAPDDRDEPAKEASYSTLVGRRKRKTRAKTKKALAEKRRKKVGASELPLSNEEARQCVQELIEHYIVRRMRQRGASLCVVHDCHPAVVPIYSFLKTVRARLRAGKTVRFTQDVEMCDDVSEEAHASLFLLAEGVHDRFTPGALFLAFTTQLKRNMADLTRCLRVRCRVEMCRRQLARECERERLQRGAPKQVSERDNAPSVDDLKRKIRELLAEERQYGFRDKRRPNELQWTPPTHASFVKGVVDEITAGTEDSLCAVLYQSQAQFGPTDPVSFLTHYVQLLQYESPHKRNSVLQGMGLVEERVGVPQSAPPAASNANPASLHSSVSGTGRSGAVGTHTTEAGARGPRDTQRAVRIGVVPNPLDDMFGPQHQHHQHRQHQHHDHNPSPQSLSGHHHQPRPPPSVAAGGARHWMMRGTEVQALQVGRRVDAACR